MSTSVPDVEHRLEETLAAELGEPVRVHLPRKIGLNAWTGNLAAAAGTLTLGVAVFVAAAGFGFGTAAKPGAGVFPTAIAAVFVILGALWLLQCTAGVVAAPVPDGADEDDLGEGHTGGGAGPNTPAGKLHHRTRLRWMVSPVFRIVVTIAVIAGFGLLVEILGYQVTMLLAMASLLHLVARSRWFVTIALSAAMAFGTFALFAFGLGVPLPVAAIPFLQEIGL